jgi:hypothetical protein
MIKGIGYWSRPFACIPPSGDGWLAVKVGGTHRLMLADGIGHGTHAHNIVCLLQQQLLWICNRSTQLMGLVESLEALHWLLRQQTSDCQAAIALVDLELQPFRLQGISVGNIQVYIQSKCGQCGLPSMNGMVGGQFPRHIKTTSHSVESDSVLALFTDGINSKGVMQYLRVLGSLQSFPSLNPQAEAETIVSRFGCFNDDASCGLVSIGQLQP